MKYFRVSSFEFALSNADLDMRVQTNYIKAVVYPRQVSPKQCEFLTKGKYLN